MSTFSFQILSGPRPPWLRAALETLPSVAIRDLYILLIDVLPAFIVLADTLKDLEDTTSTFYNKLYATLVNLNALLISRSPTAMAQSRTANEREIQRTLMKVLDELHSRFRSGDVLLALRNALGGVGHVTYPKLRALQQQLRYVPIDQDLADHLKVDIRLCSTIPQKQDRLLQCLHAAVYFFDELLPSDSPSCPANFMEYPSLHIKDLALLLFNSLQRNWGCQCDQHISGRLRLSLTANRRFETTPIGGKAPVKAQADFRILLPTLERKFQWQNTHIAVSDQGYEQDQCEEVKSDLCSRIDKVMRSDRLKMSVYGETLWQLRPDVEQEFAQQIQNGTFISLMGLLRRDGRDGKSKFSSVQTRDGLLLSFILATFVLQFYEGSNGGPWLGRNLSSENVYFLMPKTTLELDVTKPFLSATCSPSRAPMQTIPINQPHPYPVILSLGILLLEIARRSIIEFPEEDGHCFVALGHFNAWKDQCRQNGYILDGLKEAINACLDLAKFSEKYLTRSSVCEDQIRQYIFEEIVFPLGDALSVAYEVDLSTLHIEKALPDQTNALQAFDHHGEYCYEKRLSAKKWFKHLDSVHDLVYNLSERLQCRSQAEKTETRVKVAILDTGLQLPIGLQDAYKDDGRINLTQSEDFVNLANFEIDNDGHGSCVAEILLKVAPTADVHIARVFERGKDLEHGEKAIEAQQCIAKAIERAANDWKVDIIVMSFGFDQSISPIKKAIDRALKAEKSPLFFAATRNDGANKNVAWPASVDEVFGISSTDGDGHRSSFNPPDDSSDSIFYALGEAIEVESVDCNPHATPGRTMTVSGTSYATPIAAGLAATMLGCVRMAIKLLPVEKQYQYEELLMGIQQRSGMKAALRHNLSRTNNCGDRSLLPWEFLSLDNSRDYDRFLDSILRTVRQHSVSL